jgi:hypothetical protein
MKETSHKYGFELYFRKYLVLFTLFMTIACSIVFCNLRSIITKTDVLKETDSVLYVRMALGKEDLQNQIHYRLLVPFLARVIPDLSKNFFPVKQIQRGNFNAENLVAIKFGIINFIFLVAAAIILFHILSNLGLSYFQSLVGSLLFFSLTGVVTFGALPMVDTGYCFFLFLGILAIQNQTGWLLLLAMVLGLFTKETVLFLLLYILLAPYSLSRRLRLLLYSLPGIVIFLVFRAINFQPDGDLLNFNIMLSIIKPRLLSNHIDLFKILKLFLTFNFLWIPCLYAFWKCPLPRLLTRWFYLIPIFVIIFGAINLNFYRHLLVVSPVVIALALIGLNDWYPLGEHIANME